MHTDRAALLRCIHLGDVDIDHVDEKGWSPLHWMSHRVDQALAQLLLISGASLHKATFKGERAHDLAFGAGHQALGVFLHTQWARSQSRVSRAFEA